MNELARTIHALTAGQAEFSDELLAGLSPEERAALEELRVLFRRSPAELAALLSREPLPTTWYRLVPARANPAKAT